MLFVTQLKHARHLALKQKAKHERKASTAPAASGTPQVSPAMLSALHAPPIDANGIQRRCRRGAVVKM